MINQERISEEEVTLRMQQIFSINEQLGLNATFFELTTFLAFDYFRKEKVDVAIIETGLGGKLDATNVIHPLLSVITSISREHTQILGDNIEQIAAEKAGILKKHVPVILGPKARVQSIYNRAKELNCPIFTAKKVGFFDEENSQTARLALDQLSTHFKIQPAALEQGLEVRPQCRLERVGDVIFDVAHNPDAIFHLLQALHNFFPKKPLRFVVGFSKDKEYNLCLDLIADVATHIHLVQTDSSRAAKVKELEAVLKDEDPSLFTPHASIGEGVKAAHFEATAKNEILVICGSFYIMAEAKQALSFQKIP
jgi:dihydrofolate synthase/folylpolyglutamate synthase